MKLGKILTGVGAVVFTSLLGTALLIRPAVAQSSRPYVVFVNGWQNCCSWGMNALQNRLINQMNAEPRYVPYSNFDNNGSSGNTSTDERFLRDGADFINNQLDQNRPLILIGHSFGGDSVLKLLPRINRRIQLVAVIDPVRTGGLRATLKALNVPSNVDYFYNRWQENEPFPNDFKVNGSIPCNARRCDQDSQFALTDTNGNPRREKCKLLEACKTKQVRAGHQSLPTDDWIQRVIGDKIQEQIAAFQPPSQSPSSFKGIKNKASGRCLDLQEQNNRNGGFASVYDCVDHPNQTWKVNDLGNGYVSIVNKASGRCLDLQEQNNRNGGFASVYDCVDHPNQTWKILDIK